MPTFGLRPDDFVRDSRGDIQIDLKQTFYATRADAEAQTNALGTATSGKDGKWQFTSSATGVYGRDPEGNIRFYDSEEPKVPQRGACHIIVAGGQSNATQADDTIPTEVLDARVWKWTGSAIAQVPASETYLLPAFAREYAKTLPAGDWVLCVPAAVGSSGFTSTSLSSPPAGYHYYPSPGTWDRTLTTDPNNFYLTMVSKTNAAKSAALAITSTVTIDALLWSQGEDDTPYLSKAQYAAKLDDLITQFRLDVSTSLLPVVIGSMVPEYAANRGQVYTADVQAALAETPTRQGGGFATAYVYGPEGMPKVGEVIHYSTQGQLRRGKMFVDGLFRARVNRAATKPVPPSNPSIVRDASGLITVKWDHPFCRVTGYDVDFTFDGGATWLAGNLDPDSRLKATSGALPWETVQARIRTKTDGSTALSDYAYTVTLPAVQDGTGKGTMTKFVGGEAVSPAVTGNATLYYAYTLPASGGRAQVVARANDSSTQLYIDANQTGPVDTAGLVATGGNKFANNAGTKAAAGPHVVAAAVNADTSAVTAKWGAAAAVTASGPAGTMSIETLRLLTAGGATIAGAYFVKDVAHAAATMETVTQALQYRHGLSAR